MKALAKIVLGILVILILAFVLPLPGRGRITTPQYQTSDLKFPKEFFWGASTSSHQVEGNSVDNLVQWEKDNAQRLANEAEGKLKNDVPNWDSVKDQATNPKNYISGQADGQYTLYPGDIKLMQQIGLNSYRFSIDWARIEPEDGKFDAAAMQHYKDEIIALKAAGIEPFVTLWHRVEPIWVAKQGDWENPKTVQDFAKFAEYAAKNLIPDVKYWMTFNEPELHIVAGYIQGVLPPEIKSYSRGKVALKNMEQAHIEAYKILHNTIPNVQVGSTVASQLAEGSPNTLVNIFLASYLESRANWDFLDATKEQTDFIGIQYYSISEYALRFGGKSKVSVQNFHNLTAKVRSDMGWEVYPAGIYEILTQTYKRYKKPIIITENGIADSADVLRAKFISDHLYWVKKAMKEGVTIQGYFYWSLLDNFEWDKGFWPRFGLISVDYQNGLKRSLRPSALVYKSIIDNSK